MNSLGIFYVGREIIEGWIRPHVPEERQREGERMKRGEKKRTELRDDGQEQVGTDAVIGNDRGVCLSHDLTAYLD